MKKIFLILFIIFKHKLSAQLIVDTLASQKLISQTMLKGYIDIYYAHSFNDPEPYAEDYFYSSALRNEFSINLAYLDLNYESETFKVRYVPAIGSYMEQNYAQERPIFRNIFQASTGFKVYKQIWLEAGVLPSPFGYESAISKEQLTYSRSFSAENSPYYVTGVKVSLLFKQKCNFAGYVINGWQNIAETNRYKSFATQLQYQANKQWLLNWSSYFGNEQIADSLQQNYRFFNDFYAYYQNNRWAFILLWDIGSQFYKNEVHYWHTANVILQREVTSKLKIALRGEYFNDLNRLIIEPISSSGEFQCIAGSLNLDFKPHENIMLRLEYRYLSSDKTVFRKRNTGFATNNSLALASLSASF